MNSLKSQAMPVIQMLWRQKWLAVGVVWLVCTVGWIGVAFIPTKYESAARVYLNADPLLTPLLHGLAADTDPTRHLDFLQRTLLEPSQPGTARPPDRSRCRGRDARAKGRFIQRFGERRRHTGDHAEFDDHRVSQQRPADGQERGAIAADNFCREDGWQQSFRDGQRAALSRRRDRLVPRSITRRRDTASGNGSAISGRRFRPGPGCA